MPGKRSLDNSDFITPRSLYRSEVAAVDPSVENVAIPILNTLGGPNAGVGLAQSESNMYGRDAAINLAVIINGFSSVTLEVWLKATIDAKVAYLGAPPAAPVLTLPTTQDWVFVETKTLTRSELWKVRNNPPGQYKVRISAAVGAGQINILEEHSA